MRYELKKIYLEDERVDDMMKAYTESGFIIITANGGGDSEPLVVHRKKLRNRILKADIEASKYQYIPVWGRFTETDKNHQLYIGLEQAFIVFNYKNDEKQESTKELKSLGQRWCDKHSQVAFFYREEGVDGKGYCITASGAIIQAFDPISPTVAADSYFKLLSRSTIKRLVEKAFPYWGGAIYLAPSPNTENEASLRAGEIFFEI